MYITTDAIQKGRFLDRFGSRGEDFIVDMPCRSFGFAVHDVPEGTKSFALLFEDKDAIPVCGFSWIHWVAANIQQGSLPENASQERDDFLQGANSWAGPLGSLDRRQASFYGGMAPPDGDHRYQLHVFALDCLLPLQNGFTYNEMYFAMEGHLLAQAAITGLYGA